jgi:hypothetical protein
MPKSLRGYSADVAKAKEGSWEQSFLDFVSSIYERERSSIVPRSIDLASIFTILEIVHE